MLFTSIVPFAMLLASAAADLHASCTCVKQGSYVQYFTYKACSAYNAAKYPWGGSTYDNASGRCNAVSGAHLAGDQWEQACKTAAQGILVPCPDGKGGACDESAKVNGAC